MSRPIGAAEGGEAAKNASPQKGGEAIKGTVFGLFLYGHHVPVVLGLADGVGREELIYGEVDAVEEGAGVLAAGAGIQIFPEDFGASILTLPFGGFITLGLLIALMQYALKRSAKKKAAAEKAAQADKEETVC